MNQQPLPMDTMLADYPDWYRPSKYRRTGNMRVLQGRHPMGMDLGPESSKCGDCANLYGSSMRSGRTFFKCELIPATRGPGTDIVKRWRGCENWKATS